MVPSQSQQWDLKYRIPGPNLIHGTKWGNFSVPVPIDKTWSRRALPHWGPNLALILFRLFLNRPNDDFRKMKWIGKLFDLRGDNISEIYHWSEGPTLIGLKILKSPQLHWELEIQIRIKALQDLEILSEITECKACSAAKKRVYFWVPWVPL